MVRVDDDVVDQKLVNATEASIRVDIVPQGAIITTPQVGLQAGEGWRALEEGDFCAYLNPLSLVQVMQPPIDLIVVFQSVSGVKAVNPEISAVVGVDPPWRYLWYRGRHTFALALHEHARPGAVFIERSTNRLCFISPTTPKDGFEVLADWDLGGCNFTPDCFVLYQPGVENGWGSKPGSRFDFMG